MAARARRTAKERLREALARMGRGDTPVALTLVKTEADGQRSSLDPHDRGGWS